MYARAESAAGNQLYAHSCDQRCAMLLLPHHCNTFGIVHGGLLMTFADYAIFAIAHGVIGAGGVTVSMTTDFIAAAHAGELLEAEVDIVQLEQSLCQLLLRRRPWCDKQPRDAERGQRREQTETCLITLHMKMTVSRHWPHVNDYTDAPLG